MSVSCREMVYLLFPVWKYACMHSSNPPKKRDFLHNPLPSCARSAQRLGALVEETKFIIAGWKVKFVSWVNARAQRQTGLRWAVPAARHELQLWRMHVHL